MSKEKQIEEIAKELCEIECKGMRCNICDSYGCEYRMQAEALYNTGYRKQSEGEWLLIKVPTGVELYGIREVQAYPKCSLCEYMGDVSEWHFKFCPMCGQHIDWSKGE